MSIASNVIEENNRIETGRTLMQEKLDSQGKIWYNDDDLHTLIDRYKCYYVDPCKVDRRSLYSSGGYVRSTYSNEGYYILTQQINGTYGYLNLKNQYFPDECVIECECYFGTALSSNNQLRIGLYYRENDYKGVVGNIYSSGGIDIRFGRACGSLTTEYWNETEVSSSKSLSPYVWYKLKVIITKSSVSFELYDNNGSSMGSVGCAMRSGVLGDLNELCIEKCYANGTAMRIRNIKVYDVDYL